MIKAVCRDPINTSGWYIADSHSIRYFDESKDAVTLFAGGNTPGCEDGIGSSARFGLINSLIITSDGQTMLCGDSGGVSGEEVFRGGLRQINTASGEVLSFGCRSVNSVCWDRAPGVEPDSSVYYIEELHYSIIWFDIRTGDWSDCEFASEWKVSGARGSVNWVWCSSTGYVLFASCGVFSLDRSDDASVFSCDPINWEVKRLENLVVDSRMSFAVDETSRTFVSGGRGFLVTYTLPPELFLLPKCCADDLL